MVCRTSIFLLLLIFISGSFSSPLRADKIFHKKYLVAGNSLETDTITTRGTPSDRFFAPDKAKHLVVSLISTVFIYQVSINIFHSGKVEAVYYGVGFSLGLGIAKEVADSRQKGNIFSWKDLMADAAGIAAGMIIANQP